MTSRFLFCTCHKHARTTILYNGREHDNNYCYCYLFIFVEILKKEKNIHKTRTRVPDPERLSGRR